MSTTPVNGQLEDRLQSSGHIESYKSYPNIRRFSEYTPKVVSSRDGAVLSRGMLLKEARPYTATRNIAHDTDFSLQGADLFRATQLQIYGVSQPKQEGVRTILSVLACYHRAQNPQTACWISTNEEVIVYVGNKPYILRDSERPKESITFTDSAENLEQMEVRLKEDILREARKYGGVILIHEEHPIPGSSETKIVPVWLAADEVKTPKELFQAIKDEGYRVQYHRIPITANQSPEREYLDAYLSLMRSIPVEDCLIFNCGMGVVRTTYAMSAALLVRRRQMLLRGEKDPFKLDFSTHRRQNSITDSPRTSRAFEEALVQKNRTRSLLKLMDILSSTTSFRSQSELIETLTSAPQALENLRSALDGRYDIILQLLSCIDDGLTSKSVVDAVIDHCEAVVNLRSMILIHRLQATNNPSSDQEQQRSAALVKGRRQLERYFFLISFASFLNTVTLEGKERFSVWVSDRQEIRNMISRLRDFRRGALTLYAPVNDLSSLTKTEGKRFTFTSSGSLFSENMAGSDAAWASSIVQNRGGITLRPGTILKRDHWHREEASSDGDSISPAYNFRRIPESTPPLFGLSQPKGGDIAEIVKSVKSDTKGAVTWVNLREEPLVYLKGTPYVLREERTSLRNTRDYEGINAERLEVLEQRLKADVLAELEHYDGRILVHSEQPDGTVVAVFESCRPEDVKTLRECMSSTGHESFSYRRLPITAELPLNYNDISELFELIEGQPQEAIIVNCQLGKGRSTLALITLMLMQHWLRSFQEHGKLQFKKADRVLPSFQTINNLLRITRNSKEIKQTLDYFVLLCDEHVNLVDNVLQARDKARASSGEVRKIEMNRALFALKRYFRCCILVIYLSEVTPDNKTSFKQFVAQRPVFKTLEKEFINAQLDALTPLGLPNEGESNTSDERQFVSARKGTVLAPNTILKSDAFAGPEQRVLPERIEGAVNFRRSPLLLGSDASDQDDATLYGTGMPTTDGLRKALARMDATPDGQRSIWWTSLREEPVIFVDKRPFVLRLLDAPFENIVTTGIKGETVEKMEEALKNDVIAEAQANNGQILLHDEIVHDKGFELAPEWLSIQPSDVLTSRELFAQVQQEGYKVDYVRVPVTDEQAPLPDVFAALETRVTKALQGSQAAGLTFNCQLGRGRTTTGMVAASLVANILLDESEDEDPLASPVHTIRQTQDQGPKKEEDLFLQGEYKNILLLVSILPRGKEAKRYTDATIDQMDAMQNLRKAILDYIKREAAETRSVKKSHLSAMAQNYMFRYGILISFAAYLLEKRQAKLQGVNLDRCSTFTVWIADRPEIRRILRFGASFD